MLMDKASCDPVYADGTSVDVLLRKLILIVICFTNYKIIRKEEYYFEICRCCVTETQIPRQYPGRSP